MFVLKPWSFSPSGLAFLIRNEGLRTKAYKDSAGIWTIGYGTIRIAGVDVREGQTCTKEQAADYLFADCKVFVAALNRMITCDLTQNQVNALVDFMYNVGGGGFSSSTIRKNLNNKLPVTEDLFTRWNKVRDPVTKALVPVAGLTARRKREFQLFTS